LLVIYVETEKLACFALTLVVTTKEKRRLIYSFCLHVDITGN